MPEQIELTPAEQDLIGQVARFAEKRAINGVYMNQGISKSLGGTPILFLVALGEQALAVQQIILNAAVPNETSLIERANGKGF